MAERRYQGGDTIIEVLIAVSVFSLLAVGAISIMNQGINTAQKALEITQVRQQIDAQAEALRYVHYNYVMSLSGTPGGDPASAQWVEIGKKAGDSVTDFSRNGGAPTCLGIPPTAFLMNARTGMLNTRSFESLAADPGGASAPPFAQVQYDGNTIRSSHGVWIEATTPSGQGEIGYIDFHIRACWESPGAGPAMTLGTIVRLYEPKI